MYRLIKFIQHRCEVNLRHLILQPYWEYGTIVLERSQALCSQDRLAQAKHILRFRENRTIEMASSPLLKASNSHLFHILS